MSTRKHFYTGKDERNQIIYVIRRAYDSVSDVFYPHRSDLFGQIYDEVRVAIDRFGQRACYDLLRKTLDNSEISGRRSHHLLNSEMRMPSFRSLLIRRTTHESRTFHGIS